MGSGLAVGLGLGLRSWGSGWGLGLWLSAAMGFRSYLPAICSYLLLVCVFLSHFSGDTGIPLVFSLAFLWWHRYTSRSSTRISLEPLVFPLVFFLNFPRKIRVNKNTSGNTRDRPEAAEKCERSTTESTRGIPVSPNKHERKYEPPAPAPAQAPARAPQPGHQPLFPCLALSPPVPHSYGLRLNPTVSE